MLAMGKCSGMLSMESLLHVLITLEVTSNSQTNADKFELLGRPKIDNIILERLCCNIELTLTNVM